jgi:hypothetical protein
MKTSRLTENTITAGRRDVVSRKWYSEGYLLKERGIQFAGRVDRSTRLPEELCKQHGGANEIQETVRDHTNIDVPLPLDDIDHRYQ